MSKRRIIGISYNGTIEDNRITSLWDTNIDKIYYVTLEDEPFIMSRQLESTTIDEFLVGSGNGKIESPHTYEPSNLYVNCFLGTANVRTDEGALEKTLMPRAGAEVPVFNTDETLLLLSRITGGSAFIYVNKDTGVLEVDKDLLKVLSNPTLVSTISIKGDFARAFSQDIQDKVDRAIRIKKTPDKKIKQRNKADIKGLCTRLQHRSALEGLSALQREEWVRETFIQFVEGSDWTSHVVKTEVDTLCKKYTDNFKEPYTSSEIIEMSRQILYFSLYPSFDNEGNVKVGYETIEDVAKFLEQYDLLLDEIQECLACYFNTLIEQRKKAYLTDLAVKHTKTALEELEGLRRTVGGSGGQTAVLGALQSATGVQESKAVQAENEQVGAEEEGASCIHNSAIIAEDSNNSIQSEITSNNSADTTDESESLSDTSTQFETPNNSTNSETEEQVVDTRTPEERLAEILETAKEHSSEFERERESQGLAPVKEINTEDEEEDFNPIEAAKRRFNAGVVKNVQHNLAKQVREEIELDAGNCIKGCPLCGGKGYIQGPETLGIKVECSNHIKMRAESKDKTLSKINVDLKQTGISSAITKKLIPKQYFDTIWEPDKAMDIMRSVARESGMECNSKEVQEYKKSLSVVLSYVLQGKLPEYSFMFSAPNSSGKATFAYTLLKLQLARAKKVVPYLTLMELAELRKRYLLWVGNLSDRELSINKSTLPDSYTANFDFNDEDTNIIQMTPQERDAYLKKVREGTYKYTDFLDSDLLVCSMSQCNAQLPVEISTLKAILEYRARKCRPTIVMTECQIGALDYGIYVGEQQEGLFTVVTRNRDLAAYDKLLYVGVKPVRKKY